MDYLAYQGVEKGAFDDCETGRVSQEKWLFTMNVRARA